jgi:hypothetical protein
MRTRNSPTAATEINCTPPKKRTASPTQPQPGSPVATPADAAEARQDDRQPPDPGRRPERGVAEADQPVGRQAQELRRGELGPARVPGRAIDGSPTWRKPTQARSPRT